MNIQNIQVNSQKVQIHQQQPTRSLSKDIKLQKQKKEDEDELLQMKQMNQQVNFNFDKSKKQNITKAQNLQEKLKIRQEKLNIQKQQTLNEAKQSKENDKKVEDKSLKALNNYFKNHLSTLIKQVKREDYYQNKKKIQPKGKKEENIQDVLKRLEKLVNLKSKYKYQQKILVERAEILKYYKIEIKKKIKNEKDKEDSSDVMSEEDLEDRDWLKKEKGDDCEDKVVSKEDYELYKRRNKLEGKRMFIIIAGHENSYQGIREGFLSRGWVEQNNKESGLFDHKWSLKSTLAQVPPLQEYQIANHFPQNKHLTTKAHLLRNLRNLISQQNIDLDSFFPRAYDLDDQHDLDDFVENFKISHLNAYLSYASLPEGIECCIYYELKLTVALLVYNRINQTVPILVQSILDNQPFPVVSSLEWSILNTPSPFPSPLPPSLQFLTALIPTYISTSTPQSNRLSSLQSQLQTIHRHQMDGQMNVWILKPAGLSRGRGIRCFSSLSEIFSHIVSKRSLKLQWVVQKYIEDIMVIHNRKFDIRQWVWLHKQNYLRFCSKDYNISQLKSRYVHLTNNSINKQNDSASVSIPGNMWFNHQFQQHLNTHFQQDIYHYKVLPQIKTQVILSLKSILDNIPQKNNCYEFFGYDFLLDNKCQPWLIEVNSSPAMDISNEVTQKLVGQVSEDILKVTVDWKQASRCQKVDTGDFVLIYNNNSCLNK